MFLPKRITFKASRPDLIAEILQKLGYLAEAGL